MHPKDKTNLNNTSLNHQIENGLVNERGVSLNDKFRFNKWKIDQV